MSSAFILVDPNSIPRTVFPSSIVCLMSETSCAISAAAQLTPFVDYADLDGCLLMKNDFFNGIQFIDGKITLNELPGNGVMLK